MKSDIELKVNGEAISVDPVNGYVAINRKWNKGDKVELLLPMQPRFIKANPAVETLKDMATIASGPIVYCLEGCDNQDLSDLKLNTNIPMSMGYSSELLKGINVIKGKALDAKGQEVTVSAIPYYAVGNREEGEPYKVWIPVK